MRRTTIEVCVIVAVAVGMASVVLVGGAALPPPVEPGVLVARQTYVPVGETGICFEAPATAPSTSVTVGAATLCVDGHDLRVTLQVIGLRPGEQYAGSLRYTLPPEPCLDLFCQTIAVPSTLVRHIGDGIAPPTGMLRVQKELSDVRFRSGGEVTLELLRLREDAAPLAEAVFILP